MAEAEMNRLLEEATAGCDELTDEVTTTMEVVERLKERAEKLTATVDQEGDESHERFQDLDAKLERAAGELDKAGEEAKAGLDRLAAKAAEVQAEVTELLEKVKSGLAELESRRDAIGSELEESVGSTNTAAEELSGRIQDLQSKLSAHLETAGARISAFGTAVQEAQEEFEDKSEHLAEAVTELARLAVRQTRSYVESIDIALDAQGEAIGELADRLVGAHNEATGALGPKFTEEAVAAVGESLDPLQAAMDALTELCESEGQGLAEKSEAVREKAEQVLGLLERIAPVFPAAARLG
jgi:chromosome segregation ATPase